MFFYHVTTLKKLKKYETSGFIKAPVRVWMNIEEARRFSIQTGRKIILRIKLPILRLEPLEGHKGLALYTTSNVDFKELEL